MSNATNVRFKKNLSSNSNVRIFRTVEDDTIIVVTSFEDGIATISTSCVTAEEVSKIVLGCLDEKSNFQRELMYRFDTKQELQGIQFEFQGMFFKINKENIARGKKD